MVNASLIPASRQVDVAAQDSLEVSMREAKALETIASSLKSITEFVHGGGLGAVLSGYARTQAVRDILGGLASNAGRDALDARTIRQNAVEIVEVVEAVFDKYSERLAAKGKRDPEIKDSELDYKRWKG